MFAAVLTIFGILLAWAIQNKIGALIIFTLNFFRLLAILGEELHGLAAQACGATLAALLAALNSELIISAVQSMLVVIDTIMNLPALSTELVFQGYITELKNKPEAPTDDVVSAPVQGPESGGPFTPGEQERTMLLQQCMRNTKLGKRCQQRKNMTEGEAYDCGRHDR
ncbi:hypothetical protein HBI26_142090 [Parastagonospora nodorum]|nr:hypothetical protein HBI00_160630 [Parastagonospora nodorum]KAH4366654.1 hypothetical protein HBH97_166710 [Parastagonospora nodorum]KAH4389289.1 hypothetical protein HBH99_161680 [Parastagonospora nodorum]KAH4899466.1 hypothetical protein HBI80_169630 [Parastagonospora nodorum]KAH5291536.1 hypothetical protein HBI11_199480 [Parastagonospora nodorum]